MWGDLGREREGRDGKLHLSAYHIPGTLQDTLYTLAKSLPISSHLLSKVFHFNRGSVTTDGIMPQASPCQSIQACPGGERWREDKHNVQGEGTLKLNFTK